MKNNKYYTTQLQAGLGVIEETQILLDLWNPGMKVPDLFQTALDSGYFPNISARRLRNIVSECFAPRYLVAEDYPAAILKKVAKRVTFSTFAQLLFLFTARANEILADFVKTIYWDQYASGRDNISNDAARDFVIQANQQGRTAIPWSESSIKRVSTYLTGCCADFGMLENGKKRVRKIIPYRIEQTTMALLAYDLHFSGLGDNAVVAHPDWKLFGLQKEDLRDELKRLALKGFFIIQTAGDVIHFGWKYKNWEDLFDVIAKS